MPFDAIISRAPIIAIENYKKIETVKNELKNSSESTPSSNMSCPSIMPTCSKKETIIKHVDPDISETDNGGTKSAPNATRRSPCEIRRNMKSEKDRLLTYVNWPNPAMEPKELAKAGFYSTRYEDAVRCAFCNIEVCRWEEGDNAMADHQRWSNTCPFLRGDDVGNIPLDPNEKIDIPRATPDTCGRYGIEIRPNSVPERSDENFSLNKLGITPSKGPAYTLYASVESRLNTFKEWPLSIKQKPEQLADAGFFYIGKGDQTLCFSCGGGLKDWLEGDDPWEQHARWFTKCPYVLMVKGRDYVSEVCNRLPAMLNAQQAADLKNEAGASNSTSGVTNNKTPAASTSRKPAAEVSVEKDNKKVDDGRLCKICYTEELGVVFLPCGHIVACVKCAPSLSTCAVCRQPFSATVRAFLS